MERIREIMEAVTQPIAYLLAVFIGWFLAQMTSQFQVQRDKRKCVGRILYTLMRIRRDFEFATVGRECLRVCYQPSADFMEGLDASIKVTQSPHADLASDLREMLKEYSAFYPFKACLFEPLATWLPALDAIHAKLAGVKLNWADRPELLKELETFRQPLLDAIKTLAWQHGLLTRIRLWWILRTTTAEKIKRHYENKHGLKPASASSSQHDKTA